MDIPEKEWLGEKRLSLAEYLHPEEFLKVGTQKILTIFEQVALPFYTEKDDQEYLKKLIQETSLKNLFEMISNEYKVGWKFLYLAKYYCPEMMPDLKEALLKYSSEFTSEEDREDFNAKLLLVK